MQASGRRGRLENSSYWAAILTNYFNGFALGLMNWHGAGRSAGLDCLGLLTEIEGNDEIRTWMRGRGM